MAPVYLKRLLSVFCATFQSNMLLSVRKAILSLLRKIIHYIQPYLFAETCGAIKANSCALILVEVMANALDNEVSIASLSRTLLKGKKIRKSSRILAMIYSLLLMTSFL